MRSVGERSESEYEMYQRMFEKWGTDLRVSIPGIVQSFDPVEQTVTVQPAINERIVDGEGNVSLVKLPLTAGCSNFPPEGWRVCLNDADLSLVMSA